MKKSIANLLLTLLLVSTAALAMADEKKDHVCFRTLDADKDGMVTMEEFAKVYGDDQQKFNQADVDQDGQLNHDEYHGILGHGSD